MVEDKSVDRLRQLPEGTRAVWNSRDLQTGGLKTETFEEARAAWNDWLCQASNLKTVVDVAPGADAILVGSHLPQFLVSVR